VLRGSPGKGAVAHIEMPILLAREQVSA
jgi:hypothetical protein